MLRRLETAEASLARIFERRKFGMAIAAMIKITEMTINSSISENPFAVLPFPCSPCCSVCTLIVGPRQLHRIKKGRKRGSLPLRNLQLAQWSTVDRGGRTRRIRADHAGLVGEKCTLTGHASARGNCRQSVLQNVAVVIRRTGGVSEGVAALRAARQNCVNQFCRTCSCGAACRSAEASQGRGIAVVCGVVLGGGGVDGAQRTYGRRLIGRNLRAQQVRDGDGRDNQDDRHDDQELDQREAFLFVSHKFLGISPWCVWTVRLPVEV